MDAASASAVWAGFPAAADPRPLVITGPLIHETGWVSDAAKVAYSDRRVELGSGIPAAAAASLIAEIGPLTSGPEQPLRLLGAARVRHSFRTDRGPCQFAAWSFHSDDMLGPIVVVDADERTRMWPDPDRRHASGTAHVLDPSGVRLRYRFVGSPRRYTDFEGADVAAGDSVVVIAPRRVERAGGSGVRLLYAETRTVEFDLPSPLGPRVLVDIGGHPIEVLGLL